MEEKKVFVVIENSQGEDYNDTDVAVFDTREKAEAHMLDRFSVAKDDLDVDNYADEDRFEVSQDKDICSIVDYGSPTNVSIWIKELPIF